MLEKMEQQPALDNTTTVAFNSTDAETIKPQVIDRDNVSASPSPASDNALSQSEQAEQDVDISHGRGSPTPKEHRVDSERVISSEDTPSFLDTPTASSLVTGSIDSLQSEGLEVPGSQSAQVGGDEDRCSKKHTKLLASASPKHTHTHAWVQEQQQLSHTLSHSSLSPGDGKTTDQEAENEEEDFDTLAKDFDQSLDQLNQLIMDLDPEFEPNPTPTRRPMTRSASLYTNGVRRSPCTSSKCPFSNQKQGISTRDPFPKTIVANS